MNKTKLNTISSRKASLDSIKKRLIDSIGSKIVCAIVYGSVLNKDFSRNSDFDILIVAKSPNIQFLKKLREIKSNYLLKGIKIDFNVHSETDLPSVRKGLFWHNNRGIYVQKELELYGKVLIGKNVFKTNKIDTKQMFAEAVRVINSLNYQARKIIINTNLDEGDRILLIKWCIYGSLYALASRNIFPPDRKSAMQKFYKVFKPPVNPEIFLRIKVNRSDNITNHDIKLAYKFLSYLDRKIFKDYESLRSKR